MEDGPPQDEVFESQPTRIRHITGIRIHNLTLPSATLANVKVTISPKQASRRLSNGAPTSSDIPNGRVRSDSSATLRPHEHAPRLVRPRAPTLAGEALEGRPQAADHVEDQSLRVEEAQRRLARCFVVLKHAAGTADHDGNTNQAKGESNGQRQPRAPSKSSSAASSARSSSTSTSVRTRTSSLTSPSPSPKPAIKRLNSQIHYAEQTPGRHALPRRSSHLAPSTRAFGSPLRSVRSTDKTGSRLNGRISPSQSPPKQHSMAEIFAMPFYISPIHPRSSHPRFPQLTPFVDFASFLRSEDSASTALAIELWVENAEDSSSGPASWRRLELISDIIELTRLRRISKDVDLPDNTIEFTLSTDSKHTYYFPMDEAPLEPVSRKDDVVERSMRETRMKSGPGVGAVHQ